jgi:hypothetical protein
MTCLRHLNKTNGRRALYRGGGSIGIIGAARAALLAARDPDDPEGRVLAMIKSNLAACPASLRFALEPTAEGGACRVSWRGSSGYTADDLVGPPETGEQKEERRAEAGKRAEARQLLRDLLKGGARPVADCRLQAQITGISERTLERAAQDLGVKVTYSALGLAGFNTWELAAEDSGAAETAAARERG